MRNVACKLKSEMMIYSKNGLKKTDYLGIIESDSYHMKKQYLSRKLNIKKHFKRIFPKYYSEEDFLMQNTSP